MFPLRVTFTGKGRKKVNVQVASPEKVSVHLEEPGPEGMKEMSCSTQLSMKFFLLINVKMPTIVGILTFISRKNGILGIYELEKC